MTFLVITANTVRYTSKNCYEFHGLRGNFRWVMWCVHYRYCAFATSTFIITNDLGVSNLINETIQFAREMTSSVRCCFRVRLLVASRVAAYNNKKAKILEPSSTTVRYCNYGLRAKSKDRAAVPLSIIF
jgi:hypothetical protein